MDAEETNDIIRQFVGALEKGGFAVGSDGLPENLEIVESRAFKLDCEVVFTNNADRLINDLLNDSARCRYGHLSRETSLEMYGAWCSVAKLVARPNWESIVGECFGYPKACKRFGFYRYKPDEQDAPATHETIAIVDLDAEPATA